MPLWRVQDDGRGEYRQHIDPAIAFIDVEVDFGKTFPDKPIPEGVPKQSIAKIRIESIQAVYPLIGGAMIIVLAGLNLVTTRKQSERVMPLLDQFTINK